ncbi:hypothetical protein QBC38DRAFT_520149, partial [Podospora fimiseda]
LKILSWKVSLDLRENHGSINFNVGVRVLKCFQHIASCNSFSSLSLSLFYTDEKREKTSNPLTPNSTPTSGDEKYRVVIKMAPSLSPNDTNVLIDKAPSGIKIKLNDVSLASLKQGLYWTTKNIGLLGGRCLSWEREWAHIQDQWTEPWRHKCVRRWLIFQEHNRKNAREYGWHGIADLSVHSPETLKGFRLGKELKRQMIYHVRITKVSADKGEEDWEEVFSFDMHGAKGFYNNLPREVTGYDASSLMWLWPMESVAAPESSGGDDHIKEVTCRYGGGGHGGGEGSWWEEGVKSMVRTFVYLWWAVALALAIIVLSLTALALKGAWCIEMNPVKPHPTPFDWIIDK